MLKDSAPTNVAGYGLTGGAALAHKGAPGPFRTAKTLNVHILPPLADRRWDDLVARHRHASVVHHRGWLEALSRTYGYEPLVLTNSPAGSALESGMVVC